MTGAHRNREYLARQLDHARQVRGAAAQHDTRGQPPRSVSRPLEFAADELEDLVHALVDDVRHQLARRGACALSRRGRQADHFARVHERRIRRAMPLLQSLGVRLGHAQSLDQVARDVRAGILERREVANLALVKNRDAGRAAADFHERHAQFLFIVGENRVRGGERLEHEVGDAIAGALHALAQILRGRGLRRHEIHLHFEPRPRHADRIGDPFLLVDDVFLGDVVQQLVIAAQRDGARDFVHPRHVLRGDLFPAHRHDTGRAACGDVLTRDTAGHVGHARAGHPLGVLERGGNGARRLVDVAHDAPAHAAVFREPDAKNLGERRARQIARQLRDHRAGLGAAEIEPGDEAAIGHEVRAPGDVVRRRTTTCPANRASSSAYGRAFAARSLATNTTAWITSGPASRANRTRRVPSSRATSCCASIRRAASID